MTKEVIARDTILYRGKLYQAGDRFAISSQVLLKQYLETGLVILFSSERKIGKKAEAIVGGKQVEVKTMSNVTPSDQPATQPAEQAKTKAKASPKPKKPAKTAQVRKPTTRKKANVNKPRKN